MTKCVGTGTYAMCSPAFNPRFTYCWPNAKISVMGGEQAAEVMRQIADKGRVRAKQSPLTEDEAVAMKKPIIESFDSTATPYHSTSEVTERDREGDTKIEIDMFDTKADSVIEEDR